MAFVFDNQRVIVSASSFLLYLLAILVYWSDHTDSRALLEVRHEPPEVLAEIAVVSSRRVPQIGERTRCQ
jgi:hypothetical protein